MKTLILGNRRTKQFISGEQGNRYLREGLMYALVISPFYTKGAAVDFFMRTKLQVLYMVDFAETKNIL